MATDKTIFITGAASGIGRATALHFARKGWFVGLFDIDESKLRGLREHIGTGRSCAVACDVRNADSVAAAVSFFSDAAGGRMDVLFNCAGILYMGPFDRTDIVGQQKTVAVNLVGVINCIHHALPLLKTTPAARIISMSSASAVYGVPELAVYSATKFAVRGLTEALNIELAPHDITVSDIMVPYVQTPMILDADNPATSVTRLGVHITPETVAATVWNASRGRRVHWKISMSLRLLIFAAWLMPFARKSLVRALTFSAAGEKSS